METRFTIITAPLTCNLKNIRVKTKIRVKTNNIPSKTHKEATKNSQELTITTITMETLAQGKILSACIMKNILKMGSISAETLS
jgi:hypothetical protein